MRNFFVRLFSDGVFVIAIANNLHEQEIDKLQTFKVLDTCSTSKVRFSVLRALIFR